MNTEKETEGTGAEVRGWFTGRLPGDWYVGGPGIQVAREEITVVGALPEPELPDVTTDTDTEPSGAEREAAAEGRIRRFREETRSRRIEIAREAEHKFRRK